MSEEWITSEPEEAVALVWGEHWELSDTYYIPWAGNTTASYFFGHDTCTDNWYLYIGDDYDHYIWFPYSDPNAATDYNYSGSEYMRYDQLNDVWAIDFFGSGHYLPSDIIPEDPGNLLGGDNWSFTAINDINYPHDTLTGGWYIDAGFQDPYKQTEVWYPTDDPNS